MARKKRKSSIQIDQACSIPFKQMREETDFNLTQCTPQRNNLCHTAHKSSARNTAKAQCVLGENVENSVFTKERNLVNGTVISSKTLTARTLEPQEESHSKIKGNLSADIINVLHQIINCEIFPTAEMILRNQRLSIKKRSLMEPFESSAHYLMEQFSLFLEDFIGPMRTGIERYIYHVRSGKRYGRFKHDDVHIYKGFRLLDNDGFAGSGVRLQVQFDTNTLKKIRRENCNFLQYGNLVCLTYDDCSKLTYAFIANRDVKELSNGRIYLEVIEKDLQNICSLRQVDESRLIMIEGKSFYPAYNHTLKSLQVMAKQMLEENENIPFAQYFVDLKTDVSEPDYTRLPDSNMKKVSFGCLLKYKSNFDREKTPILDVDQWPTMLEMGLNEDQYEALKKCLTKEIGILQGPPGTGKTWMGLRIVEFLLSNHYNLFKQEESRPILLLSYTNHALDQFFEKLLKAPSLKFLFSSGTKPFVRVGGRCSNELVKACMIKEHRKMMKSCNKKRRELYDLLDNVDHIDALLNAVQRGNVPLYQLKHENIISEFHYKSLMQTSNFNDNIFNWLGFCENFDNFGVENQNAALNSSTKYDEMYMEENDNRVLDDEANEEYEDIWKLNLEDRRRLYSLWLNSLSIKLQNQRQSVLSQVDAKKKEAAQERFKEDFAIIKSSFMVGMTTTGAALNMELLREIQPRIVVVEEAAQVHEQHVLGCLTKHVQHLILIGDHMQLRPKMNNHRLKHSHHTDVSLMERLVMNNFPYHCLTIQRRMRPEICRLLTPAFYPSLENHPTVLTYPNVRGMKHNLFFIDHQNSESQSKFSTSYANNFEGEMIAEIYRYLILQGYSYSDITILSAYNEQVKLIRHKVTETSQNLRVAKERFVDKVHITTVDNFQGEENRIILLSLVRSNKECKLGHLEDPQRICVSLSRAREGLFVIGDFDMLNKRENTVWPEIIKAAKENELLGRSLTVVCRKHPESATTISCPQDFEKVQYGGCDKRCTTQLQCRHVCDRKCHADDSIHNRPCQKSCLKRCKNDHPCLKQEAHGPHRSPEKTVQINKYI